jgi:hypothetical protein
MTFVNSISFHVSISYQNDSSFALQEHLENLSFPCLGANKEDLLHVTHCIISLPPFGKK